MASLIEQNQKLAQQCHDAIKANRFKEANSLFDKGVSLLSTTGQEKNTPLHWAVQMGHRELVKALLQRLQAQGIPLTLRNNAGQTAFDLAKGQPDIEALFNPPASLSTNPIPVETVHQATVVYNVDKASVLPSSLLQTVYYPPVAGPAEPTALTPTFKAMTLQNEGLQASFSIPYRDLTLGKELGRGGFGVVYQGEWRDVDVAIKQLHLSHPSPDSLEDFQQEIAIMARLRSPNIVLLYGVCQELGHYSIVMEYLPKGSLYGVLHSPTPLSWPQREQIALDMACGLAFLHAENILHRDLKSLNVLLDAQYRAKLTDFGLAKLKTESKSTQTTTRVGSLPWMAPELFERRVKYTAKADIYSYGMTVWEMTSRQIPFADAHDPTVIPTWVTKGEREELSADTPPKLASLIKFCWAAKPEDRPIASDIIKQLKATESLPPNQASPSPQYLSNTFSLNKS